jgi:prepilin-type N-terminal cleavage/methylation domain-containing protein
VFRARKQNIKGVTLIELVISMAIIGFVTTVIFSFFNYGNAAFSKGNSQYSTQADLRIANDYAVQTIRFATDIELSSSIPGTIQATDTSDYLYLDGGTLIHSAYNSDNPRVVRSFGSGILGTSSFWSKKNLNSQMVGINLYGVEKGQAFDLKTNIALPNIALKNSFIADTSNAKSIKFRADTSLVIPVAPPIPGEPGGGGGEGGGGEPIPIMVDVTVRITPHNGRIYRVTFNSQVKDTTMNQSPYTVTFSVTATAHDISYPVLVERIKNNGSLEYVVVTGTITVNNADIVWEVADNR